MSNFVEMLEDALEECGKTFKDLEKAGIITEKAFYRYKTFTPFLPTIIKIVNYLKISLDYFTNRSNINSYKKYKENQLNFFENLNKVMKNLKISQTKLSEDLKIGRSNFSYWNNGSFPKLNLLIELSDYLNCNIDDLLDHE